MVLAMAYAQDCAMGQLWGSAIVLAITPAKVLVMDEILECWSLPWTERIIFVGSSYGFCKGSCNRPNVRFIFSSCDDSCKDSLNGSDVLLCESSSDGSCEFYGMDRSRSL